ncbi:helix-hairpin-helix domain-containing protein [Bacteroidales bacterium OttesenSCG-928-I21]|nr:helix-hairpin-helix domain-containing protein [Bacteroidales bacterium OttesenSCG-928-I21]
MKNKFILEYFNFSTKERNGFIVILIILISITTTNIIIKNYKDKSKYNFEDFENDIDSFLSSQNELPIAEELFYFDPNTATREDFRKLGLSTKAINSICNYREKGGKFYTTEDFQKIYNITNEEYDKVKNHIVIEKSKKDTKQDKYKKTKKEYDLFDFDPNTATKAELENLGLKSWQIENIFKYRERVGTYKQPEDLKKTYGIDDKTYDRLKNNIKISETEKNIITTERKNLSINLNIASEVELQQLRGIGPAYSKRIVEYREKLGGFINTNQLMEVYGFTSELLQQVQDYLIIETDDIKKINLNTAEYKNLISHPYIDKNNTTKILNYRKFAGEIKSFDELLQQKAVDKEFYDKLLPYFTVE